MRLWEEIRSDLSHCVLEEAPEVDLNFPSCWVTIVNIKSADPVDTGLHSGLACKGPSSLGDVTPRALATMSFLSGSLFRGQSPLKASWVVCDYW